MVKKYKKSSPYVCIVQTVPLDRTSCKKWRCANLLKFLAFMDKKYPSWAWVNVYDRQTRAQIGNYTQKKRPSYPTQPFM